ncbi:MAG: Gfo/Idh/MocA family oxidoreductase [Verrucomicrobiota bacterium]|nr:Gfo/Idh/MocA family oxidoreductase [Verrucomicrobiota bacterium]
MEKQRLVIVGAGQRGSEHAHAAAVLPELYELAAICDTDPERLNTLAISLKEKHGLEPQLYADAEKMLAEVQPDIFCFCTHPNIRLSLVELGLKFPCVKAIAFEKPIALSLKEARTIIDKCAQAKVKIFIAHIHPYGEQWQKVKALVSSGAIGKLERLEGASVGWLMVYGTHVIDAMIWLADSKVQSVWAHVHGSKLLDDPFHPSPEHTSARLRFENGVFGNVECGSDAPMQPPGNLWIWADMGVCAYGDEGFAHAITGAGWRAVTKDQPGLQSDPSLGFNQAESTVPYLAELAHWLNDDSMNPRCGGEKAMHGFEVAIASWISAVEKRRVDLPLPADRDFTIADLKKYLL